MNQFEFGLKEYRIESLKGGLKNLQITVTTPTRAAARHTPAALARLLRRVVVLAFSILHLRSDTIRPRMPSGALAHTRQPSRRWSSTRRLW